MSMIEKIIRSTKYRWHNYWALKRDLRVNRNILVFESDDWGSIRVPSRQAYDALIAEGYAMDKRPFERYDCLESDDDIKVLVELLLRYTDSKGKHPVITLNYLLTNPDFFRIQNSKFKNYSFELVQETYLRYLDSCNVISLVKDGIGKGVFFPQCHGREHFNVPQWMSSLQSGDKDVLAAFKQGMCGIFPKDNPSKGNQYMVALKSYDSTSQQFICNAVRQSLELFEKLWGYKSISFIAPCYTWNEHVEKEISDFGVRLIQSSRIQRLSDSPALKFRSIGERNKFGQVYSIRNCTFEPSLYGATNSVDSCMNEIRRAFFHGRPAVVSIHRINFVSGICKDNRDHTLLLLDELLKKVMFEYPDVEFMNSSELLSVL